MAESLNTAEKKWFVMRDLKRANANLPAHVMLRNLDFEVFTPMVWQIGTKHGRQVRLRVPVVRDLLFVHCVKEDLDIVVAKTDTLQYRFLKGGSFRQPMVVRDAEMERFINAVASTDTPVFYAPEEITPQMIGRRVRIVGGALDGQEASLLKVRGSRKKRIIVEIPKLISVGVEISPDYVELI
ncbi:MAG: UpxY family transcription antiterminator [Bacteroidales bacterium]|nr:UpxY family transcription antiterminator [Bacteroidales bacterium]